MSYTYKKIIDPIEGEITDSILRKEDNAIIPFDPDNIDYQDYLSWLSEGNEPEAG